MSRRFPGVDTYLEDPAFWRDFHKSFIVYIADAIHESLPDSYDVRIIGRVESINSNATSPGNRNTAVPRSDDTAASAGRIPVRFFCVEGGSSLQLLRREARQFVTALELVSPSDKLEPGRRDYISKRNAILREPVHLVELDFLLGGQRLPMRSALPPGDAYAIVSRCETRPDAEVYAWSLRDPLPAIRIPLRAPDPDIVLDLAVVYEETFRRGRYERNLRYDQPLQAPLPAVATEWIAARVNP